MIYTSYYSNWRNFPEACWKWQISRTAPIEQGIRPCYDFFPSEELLWGFKNNKISQEEYKKLYLEQLNSLEENNPYIKDLIQKHISGSLDIVLLCYEGRDKFCHRHILADWLNENYALEIKEL